MEDEEYYWTSYNTMQGLPLPPGAVEGGNYGPELSYVCRAVVNGAMVSGGYYPSYGNCWVTYGPILKPTQFELLLVPTRE